MADIKENLANVRKNIEDACKKVGRDVSEVTLITVSKTKPLSDLRIAYEEGSRDFGENKVQELVSKIDEMPSDVKWHLIGHLQTNKAGQIVGEVDMIQSVDSVKIAKEIAKQSIKKGIVTDVLLEINVGEEESKTGFSTAEFYENLYEIAEIGGISVKGLMTIPPICENNTILCKFFENIYNIYVDIKGKKIDNIDMSILSMGMSGDYEQAILCGSNLVRIGSSIFGPRIY